MTSFITTVSFLIALLYNAFCCAGYLNFCSADQLNLQQNIAMPSRDNLFANNLFFNIADGKWNENVLVSPSSIYASLAFIYLGAKGITANEIRKVLNLPQESKELFAEKYGVFLKKTFRETNADDDAPQVKMANRLYVGNNIKIAQSFNDLAEKNLGFVAKNADFSQAAIVDEINKWVEQQTNNKIKNIMQSDAINSQTSAVLVNTIYLKGKWLHPFYVDATHKRPFFVSDSKTVTVNFMYRKTDLRYGELNDINATSLELPYKDSDISMLIILPNEGNNLMELEKNLMAKDFNYITSKMEMHKVTAIIPKFRVDYRIDLKLTLEQLGVSSIFKENANLRGIFDRDIPQRVSNFQHQTFLECNEDGTEAGGSSYLTLEPHTYSRNKRFIAERPFVYFIRSSSTVLFSGHIATLS